MIEESRQVYEFDEFRLDVAKRQLLREGEVVPLYSKAFDLLLLLVESRGRDLSKDEILENRFLCECHTLISNLKTKD